MLPPRSARCVGTARVLYAQILDQIETQWLRRLLRPSAGAHLAQGRNGGPHDGDRSPSAQEASGGLPAKEHDRCHSGHVLVRCRRSRSRHPLADPDRAHPAAAGGPDAFDLAAGQAGAYRRGAANSPSAELRRLVRRGRQRRRRPQGVGDAHHRRSRGGLLAQLRRRAGRRARAPARTSVRCLDKCPVMDGTMYCRWHGLALTQSGDPTWSPYRAYDDGVLLWVGLPTEGEEATDRPALPARPPLPDVGQRGDRQAGHLRAPGRDRQSARSVARLVVPPVRLQPPGRSTTMPAMITCWWWT